MTKKSRKLKATTIEKKKKTQMYQFAKKDYWLSLVVFIIGSFILYFQCIPFGYVLDDTIVIVENDYTKAGFQGIYDLFTKDSFQGYFGDKRDLVSGGRYRPLSLVSFAVEYQLFGLNPVVSHIVNIILYGLATWLIFILLSNLFPNIKDKWWIALPFLISLLYLSHPIHSEAVANIKGRDEIMAMLFGMLSFLVFIKYIDYDKWYYLLLGNLFFVLGILSKENVLTFLAIIPLGLWLFRANNRKKTVLAFGSLGLSTIIYLFIRYQIMGYLFSDLVITDVMNNPFAEMNSAERLATTMYTLLEYLRLQIFPLNLTHDYYPYHIPKLNWTSLWPYLSILVHVGLLCIAFLTRNKASKICFGILFYFLSISIVSNLLIDVGTFMNERFAFMPSLGFCIVVVILIQEYLAKKIKVNNLAIIFMSLLIVAFSIRTIVRVPVWENSLSLNKAAIKVSKNSARANSFMATALFNQYKETTSKEEQLALLDEALVYTNKSLSILPGYSTAHLMKAGIAAEHYRFNFNVDQLLGEFAEIIPDNPQIGFITEYCKYLNTRASKEKMVDFYFDVGYKKLYQQKQNIKWGLHFLNLGKELAPNSQKIQNAHLELSQKYRPN